LCQFKSPNEDSIKYEDTDIEPLQSYITNKTDDLEDVTKKVFSVTKISKVDIKPEGMFIYSAHSSILKLTTDYN
jgi:hypothetical protein